MPPKSVTVIHSVDKRAPSPARTIAPWSNVTVAFGPPANPLRDRAGIHHAVHWNKLREMLRPYGYVEIDGSAQILGDGDGSVISFKVRGPAVLPQSVQDWLKEVEPKGFKLASKIAAGAATVLELIAKLFGVPVLGEIAAGAKVVISAAEGLLNDPED